MDRAAAAGIPLAPRLGYDPEPPAVLLLAKVAGVPLLESGSTAAAEDAGRWLRLLHDLGVEGPRSGWDSGHVRRWALEEAAWAGPEGVVDAGGFLARIDAMAPLFDAAPRAALHGDLQPAHVLVDPATERVAAFLDLADAQTGDPAVDIAVLTLWDDACLGALLQGYDPAGTDAALVDRLPVHRVLRWLGEVTWLRRRGLPVDRQLDAIAGSTLVGP
jgi:aminoglycoside phosphotransferase (APT) family kinase protein